MSQTTESTRPPSHSTELIEEVRESARVGQQAAAEALRQFNHVLDEAIPEAVQPLRTKIVGAAIDLANTLAATQYQFHRDLIHSADRALTGTADNKKTATSSKTN